MRQLMTYAGRNRPKARTTEPVGWLAERAVEICRTTFDRRIALEVRYDGFARAHVDAAQLEQALLNVLINARDALEGAEIAAPHVLVEVDVVPSGAAELARVAGRRDVDHVRIRVTDNGVGMDAGTLARIYEPFFTTKDVGKGTGLGLATTHAIVREHHGWIDCQSEPRVGTTFFIYLPGSGSRLDEPKREAEPSPTHGTETVLVVDDEPSIRSVVSLMLREAGYTPHLAASGQDALALLAEGGLALDVSLVLLDVSMPGIPARELRSRLREIVPRARIVYFTGYAFEAADADDTVLQKPLTQTKLLRAIRAVLDRRPPAG